MKTSPHIALIFISLHAIAPVKIWAQTSLPPRALIQPITVGDRVYDLAGQWTGSSSPQVAAAHLHQLKAMKQSLAQHFPASRSKTVFYPLSGFDSVVPLTLFPSADLFISMDDHPFILPEDFGAVPQDQASRPLFVEPHTFCAGAYTHFMDITGPDRRLAPRIFSGIRAAGMKIKSAEAFRLPEFPGKIHGIIQLDHLDAAGTLSGRTATYIQLNLTLQDGWAPHGAASNLIEELTQNELPGAVIVKAAQDRLSPSTHEPLRDAINAWLTKNQGLLVEGSSGMAGYGEFSHSQNSAFRFGIGFGYGSTAQVNQYK